MDSQTLSATINSFTANSLNSPSATVTKGVGIVTTSTGTQALSQAQQVIISGNDSTNVIPIVVQLTGSYTGSGGLTPQPSFGRNSVYNPGISNFTTFGSFIICGSSDDILTGALTPSRDDCISGAQGNDTLTGNGGDDAFMFAFQPGTANNNVDTITDIKASTKGADKIWLDDAVFTALSKRALGSSFGTKINYDSTTKGHFYDSNGGGPITETGSTLKIADLFGNATAPFARDFVVF